MEVSILRLRPGAGNGPRPFIFSGLVALLLVTGLVLPLEAGAFTLIRLSSGSTVRLDPDDIFQGGASLGAASEQVFGQGSFPVELSDFSLPLEVGISSSFGGSASLGTRLQSNFAFAVVLSRTERDQCLNDGDFAVRLTTVNPVGGVISNRGSGRLQVLGFEPEYRGNWGRTCPTVLFYGFTLDLGLEGAVAAGSYTGTTEVTVERTGPGGGAIQATQMSLEVVMPSLLLLYHPDRLDVDLRASAIAGLLGANASCAGDGCVDLGRRSFTVSAPGQPIPVGLASAVAPVATVQTVTLRNAIGARAAGCSGDTYSTADYQIVTASGGIRLGGGVISGLAGQSCGLALRTGDLSFDLDLARAAGSSGSATIQITVTGI